MPTELENLLELAASRNIRLPQWENRIYEPPTTQALLKMRIASKPFIKGVGEVIGAENLGVTLELAQKNRVTIVRNHKTDLDHHAARDAYEAAGYPELANRILYFAGYKMYERWYINFFMGSEHTVRGPTPQDFELLNSYLNNPAQLDAECLAIFLEYERKMKKARDKSGEKVIELTRPDPNCLVYTCYLEGGRSYSLRLKDAAPEVGASLGRDGYFIPIVMYGGADHSLRPQHRPNPFKRDWITMIVGEPFLKREMWDWRAKGKRRGENRNPTHYPMSKIAVLLPDEHIEPAMLPVYREITPVNRVSI